MLWDNIDCQIIGNFVSTFKQETRVGSNFISNEIIFDDICDNLHTLYMNINSTSWATNCWLQQHYRSRWRMRDEADNIQQQKRQVLDWINIQEEFKRSNLRHTSVVPPQIVSQQATRQLWNLTQSKWCCSFLLLVQFFLSKIDPKNVKDDRDREKWS